MGSGAMSLQQEVVLFTDNEQLTHKDKLQPPIRKNTKPHPNLF
jgi:hypothetical protein